MLCNYLSLSTFLIALCRLSFIGFSKFDFSSLEVRVFKINFPVVNNHRNLLLRPYNNSVCYTHFIHTDLFQMTLRV